MTCRALTTLTIAGLIAPVGCGGSRPMAKASRPASPAPLVTRSASSGHSGLARPGFSVVARASTGRVELYRRPAPGRPLRMLRAPDRGFPLVLLVVQARPGWLQVLLPVRPNQSTAWVRQADVTVRYEALRIEVSLRSHRLALWAGPRLLERQPIGVGAGATPTPTGLYYVIQDIRAAHPGGPYGPYALGLSAYSNVLQSFGGGPGQIALHGTSDPSGIGADVSHGCIELSNPEITRLARWLELGTPVRIRA